MGILNKSTADVVIIGGGVIGTAITYYLTKQGIKPILLERNDICSGSSGACDQAVSMQSKNPGLSLEQALESLKLYKNIGEELECDIEYQQCGGMIAIQNESQLAIMRDFVTRQRQNGLIVDLLSIKEARKIEPALSPALLAATYSPLDARINPLKVTFGFAKAAVRLGACIQTGVTANEIIVNAGKVDGVVTNLGVIKTNKVVNAAGAWAPFIGRMVGIEVPIKPRKGQLIVTESIPYHYSGELWSARYIAAKHNPKLLHKEDAVAAELGVGLSVSQTAAGNLLIGGTREFVGYKTNTTSEALSAILRHAVDVLPALRDMYIIRVFAGLRPYTPDGKPILGPIDGTEGFIMAAGHEGDGIALAPITGSMIANYIANGTMVKAIKEFSIGRFI